MPSLFSKIVTRVRNERVVKFGQLPIGADLSKIERASKALLDGLGLKAGFVEKGKRHTVRSVIISPWSFWNPRRTGHV